MPKATSKTHGISETAMNDGVASSKERSVQNSSSPNVQFPPPSTSLKSMLANGSDGRFRQAMYDFTSASAAMLDVRTRYAAFLGVTPPQFSILGLVGELKSSSVGQIASYLGVSSPFVTTESNKLVKQGYLRKEASDNDRRSMLLSLTDAGTDLILKVAPMRLFANDVVFGVLTDEEAHQFFAIVKKLRISFGDCIQLLDTHRWSANEDL
ncbi:MarR family transcriptional regulator [Paraburkholderia sp. Ac-20340]|uniref:MarR family winged helix-turn-helix transcriptional regulator n=1 Tax=Paraburkholderia sp. Ac-20340 TaxID=2703888 RepID=UPI00197E5D26|nr:MarR family transcriptional regulator [Paraburkholderia sp. Ac-20340]MBN3853986.1 MarR family transcriptional regulator [Paraburkholderia sp. Ac-20340]